MSKTIYDEGTWSRILNKHPDLKELAIQVGVQNNPKRAEEIKRLFKHNFGFGKLSEVEQKLATHLLAVEFTEQGFLNLAVIKGSFAHSAGANEDALAAFDLVLSDFNWTFVNFVNTCKKKGENLERISFKRAYEIFLEVIELKLQYKVPYTKLFVRQLLKMSNTPKEDSIEIKTYFLENDPTMFQNISQELLEYNSK